MIEAVRRQIAQFPTQLLLIAIGLLLFYPFTGSVHLFDWDEINFAESAREMLMTGNYRMVQINFQPFYEKPPMFIWMQALSMQYFGVNEFAARFPNMLCGVVTMVVVFNVGRHLFSSQLGVLWALLFACSILPQVYFKSGIIDPVFNLFIFLGLYFMYVLSVPNDFENNRTRKRNRLANLFLSALFIGFGTLTKGPVAILLVVLTASAYFFINRGKLKIELGEMISWWVIVALIVIAWLSFSARESGFQFLDEFIRYQMRLFSTEDAGHGGPFYYHFIVLLIGAFPASALIFDSFRKNDNDDFSQESFKKWMIYLLIVVLLVFSIVKTKIVHYSSLAYFPITFLAAYYLNHLFNKKMEWTWKQIAPLMVAGVWITVVMMGGIFLIQRPDFFQNYIKDEFARESLKATVYWNTNDIILPISYLACIIISALLMKTRHLKWAAYLLLISSGLFVNTMLVLVVPRVEKYAQAAMIEFMKSKQQENCVIETAGFKSYAHYFYARKPIPTDVRPPARYVVTKVNKVENIRGWYPPMDELYRKNGWVFFKVRDNKYF